jgi:hypothetical protein
MKNSEQKLVPVLAAIAAIVILVISLTGVIADDGGDPYVSTSLRGQEVEIYGGHGPYRYDSVYKAVGIRGYDWVNLVVSLPLLMLGTHLYRRGRLKGQLLLAAVFYHFAWNYLIALMGNAFNVLFLAYAALFSASLFGLFFILREVDFSSLSGRLEEGFPRRSLAVYILIAGLYLFFDYSVQVISAYLSGDPPASLEIYTTLELAALEFGLTIPLKIAGALLLWGRKAGGYVITTLLIVTASLTFLSLGVSHLIMYFSYQRGGFSNIMELVVFAAVSIGFTAIIFKRVEEK